VAAQMTNTKSADQSLWFIGHAMSNDRVQGSG